ncbi:MAG: zinc ribbon domain-containing protein [Planctomycetota bacterium]|nr:MAG: zinc ribbon domain-containing protein [Planctomycetota bacterium]
MALENFHCLRCNHKYKAEFSKKEWPRELTCPKCKSNSVRWLKKRAAKGAGKKDS